MEKSTNSEPLVQIIGYVCRILAHNHKESVPIYSV